MRKEASVTKSPLTGKVGRLIYPLLSLILASALPSQATTFKVVDTAQDTCYDTTGVITAPLPGQPFYGQDAQFLGNQPSYQNNGDGTTSDLNTGLMWVQARGSMTTWDSAVAGASLCRVGGYTDWRMPTIKELYSLIDFNGYCNTSASNSQPFIDTTYFGFKYGDTTIGRLIDCQDWSGTTYVGLTMVGDTTDFGVNFADGRIKGYGKRDPRTGGQKRLYVRYVRGNTSYGTNRFVNNGDGTVSDTATGLMWQRSDNGAGLKWKDALAYAETLTLAGYTDWRLPNPKELEGILDYTHSPGAINPNQRGPAIDTTVFRITAISNEGGYADYPWFWTNTTHKDGLISSPYTVAAYVCFGRALGWMQIPPHTYYSLLDVHGAGAQRSDPKTGSVSSYYLGVDSLGNPCYGRGPQGDVIRITNYVRCVRLGLVLGVQGSNVQTPGKYATFHSYPNPFTVFATVPGHETENFKLYDISGRMMGTYKGERIGEGLAAGVYFLRPASGNAKPLRIVKLR